jgi:DNA-binding beta-propeller fold protein YncE
MIIVPVAAPVAVPYHGGFDYVTVDAARRRIYAAHTGSRRLLIADADSGKVLAQVPVGPMHGSAPDPATGDVYTGNGTDRTVSKVDPVTHAVLASAHVGGPVDAIAYDPLYHRIYADEDGGTVVYVVDAKTMKEVGTVALPGHDEEYLAVDPATHVVYQNVPDLDEFVEIDPKTLKVVKVVKTPMIEDNHPLQYDAVYHEIVTGGKNGVLAVYRPSGAFVAQTPYQNDVDQCSLDQERHELACAGKGVISVLRLRPGAAPVMLAKISTGHPIHTVAIDPKTGYLWVVWGGKDSAPSFVQRLRIAP